MREAAERKRRRAAMKRQLTIAGAVLTLVAVVAGLVWFNGVKARRLKGKLTAGSCAVDTRMDPIQGVGHVDNPTYAVNPPAGGNHLGSAASAGVYPAGQVAEGNVVHSMEHGYIVLWHTPELPAAERDRLAQVQRADARDVLMVERPGMPVPVAATAWGHRLLCQVVEPEALKAFIDAYVNKGPEKIEHPAV
jgi:hypothetical protein